MTRKIVLALLATGVVLLLLLRPDAAVITAEASQQLPARVQTAPVPPQPAAAETAAATMEKDMASALHNVAQAYEQTARFPPYSIPLSEAHSELLTPNAGTTSQRDLEPYGLPGHLAITLSAYRYRADDTIEAQVLLTGPDELFNQVSRVELSLHDSSDKPITTLTADASLSANEWLYHLRFRAQSDWPEELNLAASVILTNGEQLQQSAPFRLFTPVAEITGVGTPYRADNQLNIPVHIEHAQPGYYKLGAALLFADNRPLAYLQGKAHLSGSEGTVVLQVWGSLLAGMPAPQSLQLGSFQLRRIPEKPGPEVGFGTSQQAFYPLGEVSPADYSDLPFRNAQTESRLQFLQTLGHSNRG